MYKTGSKILSYRPHNSSDILHHAQLAVDICEGDEKRLWRKKFFERFNLDTPIPVNRSNMHHHTTLLQYRQRFKHRRMFDSRADDFDVLAAFVFGKRGLNHPKNREIVRLCPPAREDDF